MASTFTDPATGRPYVVDPVTGQSSWVDENPPESTALLAAPLVAPQPAAPPKKSARRWVIPSAVGVLGFIIGAAAASGGGSASTSASPAATVSVTTTAKAAPGPAVTVTVTAKARPAKTIEVAPAACAVALTEANAALVDAGKAFDAAGTGDQATIDQMAAEIRTIATVYKGDSAACTGT